MSTHRLTFDVDTSVLVEANLTTESKPWVMEVPSDKVQESLMALHTLAGVSNPRHEMSE